MTPPWETALGEALEGLRRRNALRTTSGNTAPEGVVNLIGNDALGIASDPELRRRFWNRHALAGGLRLGSSASRVLSGSFPEHEALEAELARRFSAAAREPRAVLLMQSGWHLNTGLPPALSGPAPKSTAILADRLIHASVIDGLAAARSAGAAVQRFRHNDMEHLTHFLEKFSQTHERIAVFTESLYSMGGDAAPLKTLARLKGAFPKMLWVLDEAHAFAAYGPSGLGLAEREGVLPAVDLYVGTLGKALGGVGAFASASPALVLWLTNALRPFIFSTAMPPASAAWTLELIYRLEDLELRRRRLALLSKLVRTELAFPESAFPSHILAVPTGGNDETLRARDALLERGFLAGAIRPPTVPPGAGELRISLSSALPDEAVDRFLRAARELRFPERIRSATGDRS